MKSLSIQKLDSLLKLVLVLLILSSTVMCFGFSQLNAKRQKLDDSIEEKAQQVQKGTQFLENFTTGFNQIKGGCN